MSASSAREPAQAHSNGEPRIATPKPGIFTLDQIRSALRNVDVIECMEEGFIAYSRGDVIVPPVGEMLFDDPPGDVHIKYGYIAGDLYYVIKIASGFYDNARLNLPTSNGLMLLFNQRSGELLCVLLDEGHLTDVRTAAAGAVAAKYLAPRRVRRIGVLGTGLQARMQVRFLSTLVDCIDVTVWGRSQKSLDLYKEDMEASGYVVTTTRDVAALAAGCNLIITATPATEPLLKSEHVSAGTHITAMGSDTAEKHELDPAILGRADIVVADSISQCRERGEIRHAISAARFDPGSVFELGDVIRNKALQRQSDEQITIADLTGVAVQDLQIAKAVYQVLLDRH